MTAGGDESTRRQNVVVQAPIERAFQVFATRFDLIQPREHSLLAVPVAEAVFEPRVGGHLYDRGVDGSICRRARVRASGPARVQLGHRPAVAHRDRPQSMQ